VEGIYSFYKFIFAAKNVLTARGVSRLSDMNTGLSPAYYYR
jgi:hypothetical protein